MQVCHNKVRAFAGWPGTFHSFLLHSADASAVEELELKVLRTRVGSSAAAAEASSSQSIAAREVWVGKDELRVVCGDGSVLEILEVQAPGKRAVAARDFINGLKGRKLTWRPAGAPALVGAAAQ